MAVKKLTINWCCKRDFDFGMLNTAWSAGSLEVSDKFWAEYLAKRAEFEDLHGKLVDKVPEKVRRKTAQFDHVLQPILCAKCGSVFKNKEEGGL